jgi:hypothetical protein
MNTGEIAPEADSSTVAVQRWSSGNHQVQGLIMNAAP